MVPFYVWHNWIPASGWTGIPDRYIHISTSTGTLSSDLLSTFSILTFWSGWGRTFVSNIHCVPIWYWDCQLHICTASLSQLSIQIQYYPLSVVKYIIRCLWSTIPFHPNPITHTAPLTSRAFVLYFYLFGSLFKITNLADWSEVRNPHTLLLSPGRGGPTVLGAATPGRTLC